jgi:hypothetical protein
MSFKSDVSFPEQNVDAPSPGHVGKSKRGEVYARIKERDIHDMWSALRTFRAQYGEEALQDVIAESKK